ncbi:NAD(P)-binding domain-containing protein [Hymenobacter sp. BT664]|uniref:NAD(P)-binding domain-containing protein n=1 Tax=Hymenobacter montanus TaxID=2771359 RepID=A0A927GK25_9BACT|nr:NAD(P)-binding domain-containing protein [Hymenobacter montanus]MBD2769107.1 NAD(P)-binding domain-containing protein [Hymenobacter montanus]
MNIAVLGTGMVGEAIASRLVELGHQVRMGSRSADNEKAQAWIAKAGSGASTGTFADAIVFGEVIFLATKGESSLDVLGAAGAEAVAGKTVIDVSNPLEFSSNGLPTLAISNTDSLGEQLQRRYPEARIVKSLNTMWCGLMVNPNLVAGGDHEVFVSGNDAEAKEQTKTLLRQFGWQDAHILDLGDISTARGTEMLLPLWLRVWQSTGVGAFNFKIAR